MAFPHHSASFAVLLHLPGPTTPAQQADQVKEAQQQRTDTSRLRTDRNDILSQRTSENTVTGPVKVEKKVGRNDPCPCGSGKKYKACHGKDEV